MITNGEQIEFANSAPAELFGYRLEEMLALGSWVELIAPEDPSVMPGYCHNRADKKEAPAQYEYRGLRKAGSILWLENLTTNVVWNGKPCGQAAAVNISRSAQHLLLLINDVLDISKIEAEKLDITEAKIKIDMVMNICASMLEPQSKAKSLSLSVTHPSLSVCLLADDAKLRQIITNLLANTVKFTPARGSIHLMAECAPAGNIILKVSDS